MRAVASAYTAQMCGVRRAANRRFVLLLMTIALLPPSANALLLEFQRGENAGSDTNVLLHCKEDSNDILVSGLLPACRGKLFRWFKDGFEIFPSRLHQTADKDSPNACSTAEYQQHFVVHTTAASFENTDVCVSQLLVRQLRRRDSGNYECVRTGSNGTERSNTLRLDVFDSIVFDGEMEVQILEEHNNPSHLNDICNNVNNNPLANIEDPETYTKRAVTYFKITTNDTRLFDSNNASLAADVFLNIWDTVTLQKFNEYLESHSVSYPVTVLRFKSQLSYFCNYAEIYAHSHLNSPTRRSIVFNRFMYRWPVNNSCSSTQRQQIATTVAPLNSYSLTVVLYISLCCFAITCIVATFVFFSVRKMNRSMMQMRYAVRTRTKSETSSPTSAQTQQSNHEYTRSVDTAIPLLGVQSGSV